MTSREHLGRQAALSSRLCFLESTARHPMTTRDPLWESVESTAASHATEAESLDEGRLDHNVAKLALVVAPKARRSKKLSEFVDTLSRLAPSCDRCTLGMGLGTCEGTNRDEDSHRMQTGDCRRTLLLVLRDIAASTHSLYEGALRRPLPPIAFKLTVSDLQRDPLGFGVAGEYFSGGRIDLHFSQEFRRTGRLDGYQSIPYILAHEVISHGYWGVAVPSQRGGTDSDDAFAEGWMDRVAQEHLGKVAFTRETLAAAVGMVDQCSSEAQYYASTRCLRPAANAHARDRRIAEYRRQGRAAAERLLSILVARLGRDAGTTLWLNTSCVWNSNAVHTIRGGVPTEQDMVVSVLRAAVHAEVSLTLWDKVQAVVEPLKAGLYMEALQMICAIGCDWFDHRATTTFQLTSES
ncbi:MAG: hypothetical protein IPH80_19635 [Myxococcales bacterium]|nr:hypothetical protein [Myxococcales bacterium]